MRKTIAASVILLMTGVGTVGAAGQLGGVVDAAKEAGSATADTAKAAGSAAEQAGSAVPFDGFANAGPDLCHASQFSRFPSRLLAPSSQKIMLH